MFVLVAGLAYPGIVFFCLERWDPRDLAWALIGAIALRIALVEREPSQSGANPLWLAIAALLGLVLFIDERTALVSYPVLVNVGFGAIFAFSLWRPPSAIERIARLSEPDLDAKGVAYTRRLTWVWLCFFVANGTMAYLTARFAPIEIWALYNGLIAYVLIGALIGGEWLYRKTRRAEGLVT